MFFAAFLFPARVRSPASPFTIYQTQKSSWQAERGIAFPSTIARRTRFISPSIWSDSWSWWMINIRHSARFPVLDSLSASGRPRNANLSMIRHRQIPSSPSPPIVPKTCCSVAKNPSSPSSSSSIISIHNNAPRWTAAANSIQNA